MPADIQHLLEIATHAALNAGKAIMELYQSAVVETEVTKEFPVTEADKVAHAMINEELGHTGLPVLSEEGINADFFKRKDWDCFWMIDPLDGTKEFINKNGEFTINIALVQKGAPIGGVIYAPCTDT